MAQPISDVNKENIDIKTKIYEGKYNKDGVEYVVIERFDVHQRLCNDPQHLKQYLDTNLHSLEISNVSVPTTNAVNDAELASEDLSWTTQTTKLLLSLYQERKTAFRDPKIKKKKLWSEICAKFIQKGYKNVSEDCLDRKIRNMKKTYRTIKDNNKKSASGRGRISWEYYDTFENIFQDDCTINIGSTLCSLKDTREHKNQEEYHATEKFDSLSCEHQQFFSYNPSPINSRSQSPLSISSTMSAIMQSKWSPILTLDDSASLEVGCQDDPSTSEQDVPRTTKIESKPIKHKGLFTLRKEQLQLEEKRVKVLQELVESINTANSIQQTRNELLQKLLIQRNNRMEEGGPNN